MKASFNPISSRHCWYTVPQPFCPALPIAVVGVGWGGVEFLCTWTLVHFTCRLSPLFLCIRLSQKLCVELPHSLEVLASYSPEATLQPQDGSQG